MKGKAYFFLVSLLLVLPALVSAKGLVPCGGAGEPVCEGCQFIVLMENLFDWLVLILSVIFAILIIVSGMKMVTSAGNVVAKTAAKKMIINGIVGFVIVLGAWLLLDYALRALLNNDPNQGPALGPWNTIVCDPPPIPDVGG